MSGREENIVNHAASEKEQPTVKLWARVGVTLEVSEEIFAKLKDGDTKTLQDVLEGRTGSVRLDGETYFPDIEQNRGIDFDFNLPVSDHSHLTPTPTVTAEPTTTVFATSLHFKMKVFSGDFDECKAFCKAMNWEYTDENNFLWDLEIEDSREMPKGYYNAIGHYSYEQLLTTGENIESEFIRQHAEELVFCYQNGKSLIDFDCWTQYETLLGEKITFEEYSQLDKAYEGDPLELDADTPEACAEIKALFSVLKSHEKDEVFEQPPLSGRISDAQQRSDEQAKTGQNKENEPNRF